MSLYECFLTDAPRLMEQDTSNAFASVIRCAMLTSIIKWVHIHWGRGFRKYCLSLLSSLSFVAGECFCLEIGKNIVLMITKEGSGNQ